MGFGKRQPGQVATPVPQDEAQSQLEASSGGAGRPLATMVFLALVGLSLLLVGGITAWTDLSHRWLGRDIVGTISGTELKFSSQNDTTASIFHEVTVIDPELGAFRFWDAAPSKVAALPVGEAVEDSNGRRRVLVKVHPFVLENSRIMAAGETGPIGSLVAALAGVVLIGVAGVMLRERQAHARARRTVDASRVAFAAKVERAGSRP